MNIQKLLMILVDETARSGETTLYEAVVRRLMVREIAGATVNRGIMGFGAHHQLHRQRLLGVSDDRPVSILAVDGEDKIRRVLPEIQDLLQGRGIVLLLNAEVIA
jgi:PII-like signaling protein